MIAAGTLCVLLGTTALAVRSGQVVIEEDLAGFIQQSRAQIAQEMLLDNEFFRNAFHSDLPIDCKRCHLSSK